MDSIEVSKNGSTSSEVQPGLDNFERFMLDAVDEVFCSLGDLCAEAIYRHLSENFDIKKQEIPLKADDFVKAIEKIFGFGAKIIQVQIIENLHKKVGQEFKYHTKEGELMFSDYLTALRQYLGSQFKVRTPN